MNMFDLPCDMRYSLSIFVMIFYGFTVCKCVLLYKFYSIASDAVCFIESTILASILVRSNCALAGLVTSVVTRTVFVTM